MSAVFNVRIQSNPMGVFTEVHGFVGEREVVVLSNTDDGVWHVAQSSCLPVKMEHALAYLDCMQRAVALSREHGAPAWP